MIATIYTLFKADTTVAAFGRHHKRSGAAFGHAFEQGEFASNYCTSYLSCRCDWTSCSSPLGLHNLGKQMDSLNGECPMNFCNGISIHDKITPFKTSATLNKRRFTIASHQLGNHRKWRGQNVDEQHSRLAQIRATRFT